MVDRDPVAGVVLHPAAQSCAGIDLYFAPCLRGADQGRGNALGNRPGALRHGRSEILRIGFAQQRSAALDQHRRGPCALAIALREGALAHRLQRVLRERRHRGDRMALAGPCSHEGREPSSDGGKLAAHPRIVDRDAGRHAVGPRDADMADFFRTRGSSPGCRPAMDFIAQLGCDLIERCLNARQFPGLDAGWRPGRAIAFRIGDGAAQEQRLIAGRQRAIVTFVERVLRSRLGSGGRGGEQHGGCESMSDHARLVARLFAQAKQKGRTVSCPAPLVWFRMRLTPLRGPCLRS